MLSFSEHDILFQKTIIVSVPRNPRLRRCVPLGYGKVYPLGTFLITIVWCSIYTLDGSANEPTGSETL